LFFHDHFATGPYATQLVYDQGGPFWERGSGVLNAKDTGFVHNVFAQLAVIVLPALSIAGNITKSERG
jgi:hypothetical protein